MEENNPIVNYRENEFEAITKSENKGAILKIRINKEGRGLSYNEVLDLWANNREFVDFYLSIFKRCGFSSFRWETPPVTTSSLGQIFEFVILNSSSNYQKPDRETFREYFDKESPDCGVVSFPNLGGDAILVVPSPFQKNVNYSGLAEFLREAPVEQQRALWNVTANEVKVHLSEKPVWVSVAGGGVAWLHVRLDSWPKYYRYGAYADWKARSK